MKIRINLPILGSFRIEMSFMSSKDHQLKESNFEDLFIETGLIAQALAVQTLLRSL